MALADSLIRTLLDWQLGAPDSPAGDRFSVEGLSWSATGGDALTVAARKLEATALRLSCGALAVEVGRLTVHRLAAQVRIDAAGPKLHGWEAAEVELAGIRAQGPLTPPTPPAASSVVDEPASNAWSLAPLASADGSIRAEIVDAHLLFDAQVTVPIRQGQVRFNDATVEHVGPDSRMGVSRLGFYVDAPNGRSYLYQFPSTPVAGVEFEQRGAMLTPWVSDRGKLQLQPFLEGLLQQALATHGAGITDQARQLFDRTAVSGQVQLGDGPIAAPGLRAAMAGRADGRNAVQLHSQAVGRGFMLQVPALSLRDLVLSLGRIPLRCAAASADLTLRIGVEGGALRFGIDLPAAKLVDLGAYSAASMRA